MSRKHIKPGEARLKVLTKYHSQAQQFISSQLTSRLLLCSKKQWFAKWGLWIIARCVCVCVITLQLNRSLAAKVWEPASLLCEIRQWKYGENLSLIEQLLICFKKEQISRKGTRKAEATVLQIVISLLHPEVQDWFKTSPEPTIHHANSPVVPSLTPDFSSKILIPPKDTVRKTFCLCSPFERAEAAIPYRKQKTKTQIHKLELKGFGADVL